MQRLRPTSLTLPGRDYVPMVTTIPSMQDKEFTPTPSSRSTKSLGERFGSVGEPARHATGDRDAGGSSGCGAMTGANAAH